MDKRFYYYKDDLNRTIITVCLLKTTSNIVAKGLSICSDLDNPKKENGRNRAYGRAFKALVREESGLPIQRPETLNILRRVEYDLNPYESIVINKSTFNPELTEFEKKLMG